MHSKIDVLKNTYNNMKHEHNHEEEWTLKEYKVIDKELYTINLVLNYNDEYELVVSIEEKGKLVFACNIYSKDDSLYKEILEYINNNTFDEFINKYYEFLLNNI